MSWILPSTRSLLDVGCNAGELLTSVRTVMPDVALAGCDVNRTAIHSTRERLPDANLQIAEASSLPFRSESFDCVTCIEVLEHVSPGEWTRALEEMRRVLVPGGRLILRTPHAGLFAWLDTNNIRFRVPRLYRRLLGRGRRDEGFQEKPDAVEWHYHFRRDELVSLAGLGWRVEETKFGGLFVFPLGDYLRWPFYRLRLGGHPVERFVSRLMSLDYAVNYGRASYGILLVLTKE